MSLRPLILGSAARTARTLVRQCQRTQRLYATEATQLANIALKPTIYGQPLDPSHPHLLKNGELTPGITSQEYETRRRALMDSLPPHSAVICAAAQVKYMSGRAYKFRQDSDFWYLTGFEEPGAAFIMEKDSSSRGYRMTLFHTPSTPSTAQWDGARTSAEDVVRLFRADNARPVDELLDSLRRVMAETDHVYVDLPPGGGPKRSRSASTKSLLKYLSRTSQEHDSLLESLSGQKRRPLAPEVGRLRAIKSEAEQNVMRAAADISGQAHTKTMRFARPGLSEHVLGAHFEYLCARDGAQRPAYVPVVASGPNALTIHYTSNNQLIRENELVLVDAGCEYNGYASDITRTFPVSGAFTSAQADLYGALLSAQKQLVALCTARAGVSLAQLHHKSVEFLGRELRQIGFDLGMAGGRVAELYPHFVGHPVGIDLHESSHFDRHAPLQAGMVITVEPGVYVPPSAHFPKHFHNIGIRIEDEVLVGEEHPVVLSVSAPKEIADVEGACQGLLGLEPF
ncbi:peptidase M24 [Rhodofomes roseus]|uniref:Peptidase M24 n=1 Tax=Rhodofomes roseus TaxID=34475 RepID=A0ABQ8KWR2_9APHY|nr:peptidase M24 [Rhodofomes roseus]KAH9843656.1 peptidase M24 [Rhodofomes roseus]